MRITEVKFKNASYVYVYIEGEYALAAHTEAFAAMGLRQEGEITPRQLEELRKRTEFVKAREKALNLLSYRDYSSSELYERLCEKYEEDSAEAAVYKMMDLHLIDDQLYAEKLVRVLSREKLQGERKIRQELAKRGIDADVMEQALLQLTEDECDRIVRLVQQKYLRKLKSDPEKGYKRVYDALIRRGYGYADVKAALDSCMEQLSGETEDLIDF